MNTPSDSILPTLPPEVLLKISSHLPQSSLADLSMASRYLHELLTPGLYTRLICGNLTGTLRLFRRLAKDSNIIEGRSSASNPSERGVVHLYNSQNTPTSYEYIHRYASSVTTVHIPYIIATHEVKSAIANALAQCIELGKLPNLKELDWPFTYIKRGFLEDVDAARFDERLWQALLDTYDDFEILAVFNASHVPEDSPLWLFGSKCKNFTAPRPSARVAMNSLTFMNFDDMNEDDDDDQEEEHPGFGLFV